MSDKLKSLESKLISAEKLNQEKSLVIGKLESELDIKNKLFEKLEVGVTPEKETLG